jgi:hypothetical protein
MLNIDKSFPPSFFSNTDVNKILKDEEIRLLLLAKTKNTEEIYSEFNENFSKYLLKLPNSFVKSSIQDLYNNNLIFLSVAKAKADNINSRPLIYEDNKLAGIVLDTQQLGVNPETGSADSPGECIYASYFSLIRAAILINKKEVKQNKDLHKLMSTYLYMLLVKAIGPDKIYSAKQKSFVYILSIYSYYKCYLDEKHSYILSIIERDYTGFIGKEIIQEFLPTLEKMKSYKSIKDFPKMLVDSKILNESPNILIVSLLKMLKPMGFYSLIGPLDYFIALSIVSKYPVDFIGRKTPINEKMQNSIEEIVKEYIDKIKYNTILTSKE